MRPFTATAFSLALVALGVAIAPGTARADDGSAEIEARAFFDAGRLKMKEGDCQAAIQAFRRAIGRQESIGARMNMASCYESGQNTRSVPDAVNQLRIAERMAAATNDPRAQRAAERANELEATLAKLQVTYPRDAIGVAVTIDGRRVDATDMQLLDTGYAVEANRPHAVEVQAADRSKVFRGTVEGGPRALLRVDADLGPKPPPTAVSLTPTRSTPPAAPRDERGPSGVTQRSVALVMGGAGVLGLGLGATFGVVALSKANQHNDAVTHCATDATGACLQSEKATHDDLRDSTNSAATASTIGFVAGGVLLAGGAALWLTAPNRRESTSAHIRALPLAGPGIQGAVVSGSF